jgi:hypothetical protein
MRRPVRLNVEYLEDRCTPATWGNPWPDASHLTVSLAPDGTPVGDRQSNLFQALNAQTGGAWQREILRGLQTWAASANINLGLTADAGLAAGTRGAPQGDARFGDIRVTGVPMAGGGEAAVATPFDTTAGTWAGDIRLNSAAGFGAGGYDLYTVLLHEAGHALGLDHSSSATAVMYPSYNGVKKALTSDDVSGIRNLYSGNAGRPADAFDAALREPTRRPGCSAACYGHAGPDAEVG